MGFSPLWFPRGKYLCSLCYCDCCSFNGPTIENYFKISSKKLRKLKSGEGDFPATIVIKGAQGREDQFGIPPPLVRVLGQCPRSENLEKKFLVKCCNFRVMTWSIMGELWAHGISETYGIFHGIPFIKGRTCNTDVYCMVAF